MRKITYRKNKKTLNKLLNLFTVFIITSHLSTITMASGTGGVDAVISEVTSVLAALGFLIAIGKIMQIGIMFMLGAGKNKSDAKSSLIPWFVGAFVCALYATIGPAIIGMIMGGGSGGVFDI